MGHGRPALPERRILRAPAHQARSGRACSGPPCRAPGPAGPPAGRTSGRTEDRVGGVGDFRPGLRWRGLALRCGWSSSRSIAVPHGHASGEPDVPLRVGDGPMGARSGLAARNRLCDRYARSARDPRPAKPADVDPGYPLGRCRERDGPEGGMALTRRAVWQDRVPQPACGGSREQARQFDAVMSRSPPDVACAARIDSRRGAGPSTAKYAGQSIAGSDAEGDVPSLPGLSARPLSCVKD